MIKQFDFDLIKHTEQLLRNHNAKNLLLGISGGMDSVALLHHLVQVSEKFYPLNLHVCHVHHGITNDEQQLQYRTRAQSLVSKLANQYNLPFMTNDLEESHSSDEESFRNLRDSFFSKILNEKNLEFIVKGHNRDDLLETRLIRMIRGVGDQGLKSMSERDGQILRPILSWTRKDVEEYCRNYGLDFIEDPSNKDEKYLRNWIRNKWLNDLENYRPGAKSSLSRSLENICEALESFSTCDISATLSGRGIDREKLMTLNRLDQRRAFAVYLNKMKVKNYSHSQIDEILKRLDSSKKELTFTIMGCEWHVDTKHISICEPNNRSNPV